MHCTCCSRSRSYSCSWSRLHSSRQNRSHTSTTLVFFQGGLYQSRGRFAQAITNTPASLPTENYPYSKQQQRQILPAKGGLQKKPKIIVLSKLKGWENCQKLCASLQINSQLKQERTIMNNQSSKELKY